MLHTLKKYTLLVTIALLGSFAGTANRVEAQTYQIDCAILLCLSGGWSASVPCARARAEFIRRITPWPVEPPLQIWRCPMGASFYPDSQLDDLERLYDILLNDYDRMRHLSFPTTESLHSKTKNVVLNFASSEIALTPHGFALRLVQDRADIDISGTEFNFVRSIRVYDVQYARQQPTREDCMRSAAVYVGTYGQQGGFSWARSAPRALPEAHTGLERWGYNCLSINHRSVYVDWYDYEGNYGFEQINY